MPSTRLAGGLEAQRLPFVFLSFSTALPFLRGLFALYTLRPCTIYCTIYSMAVFIDSIPPPSSWRRRLASNPTGCRCRCRRSHVAPVTTARLTALRRNPRPAPAALGHSCSPPRPSRGVSRVETPRRRAGRDGWCRLLELFSDSSWLRRRAAGGERGREGSGTGRGEARGAAAADGHWPGKFYWLVCACWRGEGDDESDSDSDALSAFRLRYRRQTINN